MILNVLTNRTSVNSMETYERVHVLAEMDSSIGR